MFPMISDSADNFKNIFSIIKLAKNCKKTTAKLTLINRGSRFFNKKKLKS